MRRLHPFPYFSLSVSVWSIRLKSLFPICPCFRLHFFFSDNMFNPTRHDKCFSFFYFPTESGLLAFCLLGGLTCLFICVFSFSYSPNISHFFSFPFSPIFSSFIFLFLLFFLIPYFPPFFSFFFFFNDMLLPMYVCTSCALRCVAMRLLFSYCLVMIHDHIVV